MVDSFQVDPSRLFAAVQIVVIGVRSKVPLLESFCSSNSSGDVNVQLKYGF